MIYIFEGARNSGKTHLSGIASSFIGKGFQYEFVDWFRFLDLDTKNLNTHIFALGKETMLLQLNRDGLLTTDFVLDRGIFSVMSWGILEGRITLSDAQTQMEHIISKGLLSNCKFIHIKGNNPKIRGSKDEWDSTEVKREVESSLIGNLMEYSRNIAGEENVSFEVIEFINTFDRESEINIARII